MMNQKEKAALLKAYHAAKVAADKAKAIADQIKAEMEQEGENRWEAGGFIASISTYTTTSLDTKALKADHAELCKQYMVSKAQTRLNFK